MKFRIRHEIEGRIRVELCMKRMSADQADILEEYLKGITGVSKVKVNERTCSAAVSFKDSRDEIILALKKFNYQDEEILALKPDFSSREMNSYYKNELITKVVVHYGKRIFLPASVRAAIVTIQSLKYIWKGIKTLAQKKLEVPVLDATAIAAAVITEDYSSAGTIMFLLGIGELLEEWTHKKSVDDLARSMSLHTEKVWLLADGQEVLVDGKSINAGDLIVIHMGNVIPFDGTVISGEGMVNQSSMTGESEPVKKDPEGTVFAGTVLEEGELTIRVTAVGGATRYEKIVSMIEDSEKLKSSVESEAEHLADSLVPVMLGGTALTYLITRNVTKAIAVLMVDFSCALKLAMPISVLSAIREAGSFNATVKGGKYLEALADADTIVFDKTGTLTKAQPKVKEVISFCDDDPEELLRVAACLEEHFPHSMAKAVVKAAEEQKLLHEEMHTKVEYIVAHGIATTIKDEKVVLGSAHFVFEDEKCEIAEDKKHLMDTLPTECSFLYLGVNGKLAAVICIEDPVREEAADVIRALRTTGISKIVMMTGDSERTASVIAERVGVDEYFSEVLPQDKASFVEHEKELGRKVIMIGDGINDSPALSAANVGIAISDGAQIAREIADVTISGEDLYELVELKKLSNLLMKRIHTNYRTIVGFNSTLIILGVLGILTPSTSAVLHNGSTIAIGLKSMTNLLTPENE